MNKILRKNAGFAHVGLVVFIVVVAAVVAAGWIVFKKQPAKTDDKKAVSEQTTKKVEKPQEKVTWLVHENEAARIQFMYPSNWTVKDGDIKRFDEGQLGSTSGTVTSPSGNTLDWVYAVWGGKGGDCEPLDTDIAFREGNKCNSRQIYSSEKLDRPTKPGNNLLRDNLYISKSKYKSSQPGSATTYQMCLDAEREGEGDRVAVGARMGLLFKCDFWDHGFNAVFQVESEAGFNSDEAKAAEKIMRSFDSL